MATEQLEQRTEDLERRDSRLSRSPTRVTTSRRSFGALARRPAPGTDGQSSSNKPRSGSGLQTVGDDRPVAPDHLVSTDPGDWCPIGAAPGRPQRRRAVIVPRTRCPDTEKIAAMAAPRVGSRGSRPTGLLLVDLHPI